MKAITIFRQAFGEVWNHSNRHGSHGINGRLSLKLVVRSSDPALPRVEDITFYEFWSKTLRAGWLTKDVTHVKYSNGCSHLMWPFIHYSWTASLLQPFPGLPFTNSMSCHVKSGFVQSMGDVSSRRAMGFGTINSEADGLAQLKPVKILCYSEVAVFCPML